MPRPLLINYGRSVKIDHDTIIGASEASRSLDSEVSQLGELGQWYQDIVRANPGDNASLQAYLRRCRARENQIEGISVECMESKLMEMIGTVHANGELDTQDWGVVALPHALIVQEREMGVVGLNDGVGRERGEDWYELEVKEEMEVQPVGQVIVDVVVKQEEGEVAEVVVNEESTKATQSMSEAEACRDLLRQLEDNPKPVRGGRSETKACRELLRKLEENSS
jgi:hypothetical protein